MTIIDWRIGAVAVPLTPIGKRSWPIGRPRVWEEAWNSWFLPDMQRAERGANGSNCKKIRSCGRFLNVALVPLNKRWLVIGCV